MVDLGAAGAAGARLDEVQIGEPERIERLHDMGVERHRIGFTAAIGDAVWRQPQADAVGTPNLDHRLRHFHQEARTVLDSAAILISAQIGVRLQELLDQVTVGAVDLDAVEAGGKRVLRGLPVGIDHARNFGCLKRARRLVDHRLAVRRPGLQIGRDRDRRWRHRQHAAGLERGMRDASDMPELEEDHAAPGVNGIDHLTPARDLLLGINTGNAGAAKTRRHHGRGLGDQQSARRRALGVILRIQWPGREARLFRPHPGQGRQCETMFELVGTDLQR
jgi:hypothetical protein